jgi:hypothetical protein
VTQPSKPHYDTFDAWLAHAPIDEIADAILDAYTDEQVDELLELLEERIRANPEN